MLSIVELVKLNIFSSVATLVRYIGVGWGKTKKCVLYTSKLAPFVDICLLFNVRCISFTFACSVMSLGSMRGDPSKAGFPTVNLVRMIRLACILHY